MGIREQILEELDCDIEFEKGSGYIEYLNYGHRIDVIIEIAKMISEGLISADENIQSLKGGWFYRK